MIALLATLTLIAALRTPAPAPRSVGLSVGGFRENRGQWSPEARFRTEGGPGPVAWITRDGLAYQFETPSRDPLRSPLPPLWGGGRGWGERGPLSWHRSPTDGSPGSPTRVAHGGTTGSWTRPPNHTRPGSETPGTHRSETEATTLHTVRVAFVGGDLSRARGVRRLPGVAHYGPRPNRRAATDVRTFEEVRAPEVWPGVAARLYRENGRPRYDFLLSPGADPRRIRLRYRGARRLRVLPDGRLRYETPAGPVEERSLRADQNGRPIPVAFVVRGQEVTFRLGSYDRRKPLRIDPLVWSRYVGGGGGDYALALALLPDGSPVVAGHTDSSDLEAPGNAAKGALDAFVARLSSDGRRTLWTRYVGGSGGDSTTAVTLLSDGSPVVAGYTYSADLEGAVNAQKGGADAFVARLSADGRRTVWSRYVGGGGYDSGLAVALLADGSPMIAGYTFTPGLEGATNAHRGGGDAFVARLSPDGSSTIWCRYVGGRGDDLAPALALLPDGSSVVAGYTYSTDLEGAVNTYKGGGDGLVARLSADGRSTVWSRYLGGSGSDLGLAVALLADGSPVVAGYTTTPNLEGAVNAHQGGWDALVARLSSDGRRTVWARYVGGGAGDFAAALALLPDGSPVVAGSTDSSDLESTVNGKNGDRDAFAGRLSADGRRMVWTRYVGGSGADHALAIALRSDGSPVVAGYTPSSDLERTVNADEVGVDAFVARLADEEDDAAGTPANYPDLFAPLLGADGTANVAGVVCDNLRDTPEAERNGLDLNLRSAYARDAVWGFVTDERGVRLSAERGGTLTQTVKGLRYTPPLEFPGDPNESLSAVRLRIHLQRGDARRTVLAHPVLLARTPVVLVHGVHSNPGSWRELVRRFPNRPWLAVDHSTVQRGNGPVELAALRLSNEIKTSLSRLRRGSFVVNRDYDGYAYAYDRFSRIKWSARRLDVAGWSYGGLVARWYLASDGTGSSLDWYRRPTSTRWDFNYDWTAAKTSLRTQNVERLTYGGDVRKFVTLGTMWRGVPTCNWTNEIRAVGGAGDPALGNAPALVGGTVRGDLSEAVRLSPVKTAVAAQEVMAVDSPWSRRMIYGTPFATNPTPRPFRDDVAYFAIGGDAAPLPDPYQGLGATDANGWFPYLMLEVRQDAARAFSDGIVPLWSQILPGANASGVVALRHEDYPNQDAARNLLLEKLDSPTLRRGADLNAEWGKTGAYVESEARPNGKRYRWTFRPEAIAPWPQSKLYVQVPDAADRNLSVARIANANVRPQIKATVQGVVGGVRISWPKEIPFTEVEVWESGVGINRRLATIKDQTLDSWTLKNLAKGATRTLSLRIRLELVHDGQTERLIEFDTNQATATAL